MPRLLVFRRQLATLWRAFLHPATPLYLKAIMVGVVVYLISPIDIIPDFLAVLGWVDDVLLVAIAVSWIISKLPAEVTGQHASPNASTHYDQSGEAVPAGSNGPVIDGKARRL